jgi:glucose/arabinose dehydrogenase
MSKFKLGVVFCLSLLLLAIVGIGGVSANRDVAAINSSTTPDGTITIQLQPVVSGLSSPVFVTNAHDGTNRLFIVEQGGLIKVLQPGATTPTVFANLTTFVTSGGERGLLGLTFHPQFQTNRRFFVYFTRAGDAAIQVSEFKASIADPNVADTLERPIITVPHPTNSNHNGGTVEFGPDGYLYLAPGDGGSSNDPPGNSQNIDVNLGKMLRINVDDTGTAPYLSPPDNPFFGAIPGNDEIYAYGLRNPYRFSFDRGGSRQLYVGDVGQNAWEEIDIVTNGGNYGWKIMEGNHCNPNINGGNCTPPVNHTPPIAEYSSGPTVSRCSITGGRIYRGRRSALPFGSYVFADYCTGEIILLNPATGAGSQTLLLDTTILITAFGEDEAGEIYVVGSGAINRIVNPNAAIPRNVVCDFDGDLSTDISVFRPTTGTWYVRQSFTNGLLASPFGTSGDTVTPGDYDGDGKTDIAVWRPCPQFCGIFYWLRSSNGTFAYQGWGAPIDDARIVADYDGDKKTDFAITRSSFSLGAPILWNILLSSNGQVLNAAWGITGDLGIIGDFDGDGLNDITVYRPSNNVFYVRKSSDGSLIAQQWGLTPDDRVTPGDYDGDGKTDFAVFRQPTGTWYILQSSNGQLRAEQFGANGDRPVPGDYDGDGKYDLAVSRDTGGSLAWYILRSGSGSLQAIFWGSASDFEVPRYQTR